MCLSQFSYGKLETMRLAGKQLPVVGGYDADGSLTTDPAAIEETRRMIPHWLLEGQRSFHPAGYDRYYPDGRKLGGNDRHLWR